MEAHTPARIVMFGSHMLLDEVREELESRFDAVALPWDAAERQGFLDEHAEEVRAVVTPAAVGVGPDLMAALPNLELVDHFGVGYDGTDIDEARRRGIAVTNTPDVLNDCVADLAVGLMIDTLRRVSAADRYTRAGDWTGFGSFGLARQVTGTRVGILGLGRIGVAIAERLAGFRCEIRYHNRHHVPGSPFGYEPSACDLARWADVLVVAVPGGAATRALVDADVLAALGAEGHLVNIARGSVVDESALVRALQDGVIAGAGLDVFADEPHAPEELFSLDNVVLTPHIASATVETRRAMGALCVENLRRWVAGEPLATPVV